MHTDQTHFPEKPMLAPHENQIGYYTNNAELPSSFLDKFVPPGIKHPMPFLSVDIQPNDACPRNFVIFDQTNTQSQIMFHPEFSSKLFYPTFGVGLPHDPNSNDEKETESLFEDDYDDIDLLMSSEFEESDEPENDEISTARTVAYYECGSPDSCSNCETLPKKRRMPFGESSGIVGIEKKHKRMRKMVKVLRGLVPGTDMMSAVSVLDESVRYLKSLRAEVQKLGIENVCG